MKKTLLILAFLGLCLGGFAQTKATQRTALVNLQRANIVESSRAGQFGLTDSDGNQRYAQFVEIDLVPIAYTPTTTGNTQNYSEFVSTTSGDVWYIDWQGRGLKIYSAAAAGDRDWLEIGNNQVPDNIRDSIYTDNYASVNLRYVWPNAQFLTGDSTASNGGNIVVLGNRESRVGFYRLTGPAWSSIGQEGGSLTARLGTGTSTFIIQSAGGASSSQPAGPYRNILVVGADSTIQMHDYPRTRNDTATAVNFLYTDAIGILRSSPISELPSGGGGCYSGDTTWMQPYTQPQKAVIREGILCENEVPDLTYSVPVPDTVFYNTMKRYGWRVDINSGVTTYDVATNISTEPFQRRESFETVYYISPSGNDASAGTSVATAWKTPKKAIQTVGAKHIYVLPGNYCGLESIHNATITEDKVFKRLGGNQGDVNFISGQLVPSWTLTASTTATYEYAYSSIAQVIDFSAPKNADNTFAFLNRQTSIAAVDANPGSYYFDSGAGRVYVRTFDSRNPAANTICLVVSSWNFSAPIIPATSSAKAYFEGIDFVSRIWQAATGGYNSVLALKNCRRTWGNKYTSASGGFTVNTNQVGYGLFVCEGCEAYENSDDGFSYGNVANSTVRVYEINCTAYSCFDPSATAVDGSSIHNRCSVVRVGGGYSLSNKPGGYYYDCGNNGIHDTGLSGGRSWNIGVRCYNQRNLNVQGVDFYMGGPSSTGLKTWNTLCNTTIASTSTVQWKNEGGTVTTELRWCYPQRTSGAPTLGTTQGTLTVIKR